MGEGEGEAADHDYQVQGLCWVMTRSEVITID